MSSRFPSHIVFGLAAGIAFGMLCAGCERQSAMVNAQTVSSSQTFTSVGPVPGPNHAARGATNPFNGDAAARQAGRDLFVRFNCYGCHGGHAGGGMGPSLRDEDWIYGRNDAQVFDSIAQGRANGMPAWGTLVQPAQIWQIVTYIESLRTADEPQPPT